MGIRAFRVEVIFESEIAEGPEEAAKKILDWIRQGNAIVADVYEIGSRKAWRYDESEEEVERLYER